MICKHDFKKLRESAILKHGQIVEIEVWHCANCQKYMIIDLKSGSQISLNGELGPEITNLN